MMAAIWVGDRNCGTAGECDPKVRDGLVQFTDGAVDLISPLPAGARALLADVPRAGQAVLAASGVPP